MANKKIMLITGGAGFIGSHMVDHALEQGYQVRVVDNLSGGREANLEQHKNNPDLTCEWTDIRALVSSASLFKGLTHVVHFAGIGDIVPSIENPIEYMSVNVQGTVNILEGARAGGIEKFVYAASSSCYGMADVPTREDHAIDLQYPYALSKYMGEQAAFHWHQIYNLPVNTIRIFNAYGPRVRTTGAYGAVFGVFFKQKLAGKPFTVVGDGTQKRDFLYVTDVARAFMAAAQSDIIGETWNLGAGDPQMVNHLVELIGGTSVSIPKRPGEPECTWADISKITRDLNWRPEVDFETGVERMMAEIDVWQDAPLWTPDSISQATKTWFQYLGEGQKK